MPSTSWTYIVLPKIIPRNKLCSCFIWNFLLSKRQRKYFLAPPTGTPDTDTAQQKNQSALIKTREGWSSKSVAEKQNKFHVSQRWDHGQWPPQRKVISWPILRSWIFPAIPVYGRCVKCFAVVRTPRGYLSFLAPPFHKLPLARSCSGLKSHAVLCQ